MAEFDYTQAIADARAKYESIALALDIDRMKQQEQDLEQPQWPRCAWHHGCAPHGAGLESSYWRSQLTEYTASATRANGSMLAAVRPCGMVARAALYRGAVGVRGMAAALLSIKETLWPNSARRGAGVWRASTPPATHWMYGTRRRNWVRRPPKPRHAGLCARRHHIETALREVLHGERAVVGPHHVVELGEDAVEVEGVGLG